MNDTELRKRLDEAMKPVAHSSFGRKTLLDAIMPIILSVRLADLIRDHADDGALDVLDGNNEAIIERALRIASRVTVENVMAAIEEEGADGCASQKEIATAIVRKLTGKGDE